MSVVLHEHSQTLICWYLLTRQQVHVSAGFILDTTGIDQK